MPGIKIKAVMDFYRSQYKAADAAGVSQAAVNHWIHRAGDGYVPRRAAKYVAMHPDNPFVYDDAFYEKREKAHKRKRVKRIRELKYSGEVDRCA